VRKIILIISIFCLALLAHSQTDTAISNNESGSKLAFGVNISYFTAPELYFNDGFAFTSSLSVNKNKHTLLLAPVWWIDKNEDVSVFRGGLLAYQYFPHKPRKRINFYFIYDLAYLYEKKEWDTQIHFYPQKPINQVYNAIVTTKWRALVNQFGYGFNLRLFKGLYLNQSFSIGMEFYSYKSETDVKEDSSLSSEYASGGNGASSFLKIGFGYNFE